MGQLVGEPGLRGGRRGERGGGNDAREDGYDALSLSVREDEPARLLYERYGFRKVGEDDGAWTMVAQLA